MKSISQKPEAPGLPDFRSLGVVLRVLLGVNLLAAAAALVKAGSVQRWPAEVLAMAGSVQPVLLVTVALLAGSGSLLARLPLRTGQALVVAGSVVLTLVIEDVWRFLGLQPGGGEALLRAAVLAAFTAGIMLLYFELRARAAQPANTEARLAALTARIRPHFLFNSLNAVLSLIRDDPRRAESALESLADLYRVLMRDPRDLAPLSEEIALCRQYLDLERLRLGERLRVVWEIAAVPDDARVPPLMLQPLLENAVYHGIEPAPEGGELRIRFARADDALLIELRNPLPPAPRAGSGNHMALANIRERLMLHYDLEARLLTEEREGAFHVTIRIPYRQ